MTIFFTSSGMESRGRVQALHGVGTGLTTGSILRVEGWGGFEMFKAIFTNVTISEQGNYQFLHTLGDHIYVNVFGDRMGTFGLSGLAFYDNCTGRGRIGIVNVIDYYRRMRLARRPFPMLVTIDPGSVFRCFLLGMQGQVVNTAERLFQFHLNLALVPDTSIAMPTFRPVGAGAEVREGGFQFESELGPTETLDFDFGDFDDFDNPFDWALGPLEGEPELGFDDYGDFDDPFSWALG